YTLLFFTATATTEIYTLSLHDALPIWTFEQRLEPLLEGGDLRNGTVRGERYTGFTHALRGGAGCRARSGRLRATTCAVRGMRAAAALATGSLSTGLHRNRSVNAPA